MADFEITLNWMSTGQGEPEARETGAHLAIRVGGKTLTRNEDVWSRTVRDSVLVSAYPLAMWFAASWWRLNYEPSPEVRETEMHDWRMSHELGAASHGYVWPSVVFAPEGESIRVWSLTSGDQPNPSFRYTESLVEPCLIPRADFQREIDAFVAAVLARLDACGLRHTELATLWHTLLAERADPELAVRRRLEAGLGYDPGESPDALIDRAIADNAGTAPVPIVAPLHRFTA